MKAKYVRIAPFILAVVCFIFPFIQISCRVPGNGTLKVASLTGLELVTGTELTYKNPLTGEREKQKVPGEKLVLAALICIFIALLMCFLGGSAGRLLPAAFAVSAFICLVVEKIRFDKQAAEQGEGLLTVACGFGFIATCILLLGGAGVGDYEYFVRGKSVLNAPAPTRSGSDRAPASTNADQQYAPEGILSRETSPRPSNIGEGSPEYTRAPAAEILAVAAKRTEAVLRDALEALKGFVSNPVDRLPLAFEKLGPSRAGWVGVAYGGVFWLCLILAACRLWPSWSRPHGFGGFIQISLASAVPVLSLFGAVALGRKIFRGQGAVTHDGFIAGTSCLPLALAALGGFILGFANLQIIALFVLFGVCLTNLMLFAGLTRICKITERDATVAVPLILVTSGWLSKVIYAPLL